MGQTGGGGEDRDGRSARQPNPVDVHVGSRVRSRRVFLRMSQERLGELLGLTFQQVQKYEKGDNRISASRLFDLARVLGVPVQYFYDRFRVGEPGLGEEDEPFTVDGTDRVDEGYKADEFIATREGGELITGFMRIPDAQVRRGVLELIRSLAGKDAKE